MKFNLFKKKYPKIAACWNKGKDERFPEGENTNDVIKRVNKFLLSLKKYKDKKKILLISHSFFLRVLIGVVLNYNLKKIYKLKLDHLKVLEILRFKDNLLPNFDRVEIHKFYRQLND